MLLLKMLMEIDPLPMRGSLVIVVVLCLTVEWGVGMERQDPSYGVVVHTSV